MKQLTSYWLRMGLAALAGLIVAVLLHYFWASDKKDLVSFDKMRLSYGWSLTVGALVLVVLDFLSYWLLCGTAPLNALIIGLVCPLIVILIILLFYRPKKKNF